MRGVSRRFPNGVTVYIRNFPNAKVYTAIKNGRALGYYRIESDRRRGKSRGKFLGQGFRDFYGWLRAARGARA